MSDEKHYGYHIQSIQKGIIGESSKILEEVFELQDAEEQQVKIMQLVELSDIVGAIDMYLQKHFPYIGFEDLVKMSKVTQRAFKNGRR